MFPTPDCLIRRHPVRLAEVLLQCISNKKSRLLDNFCSILSRTSATGCLAPKFELTNMLNVQAGDDPGFNTINRKVINNYAYSALYSTRTNRAFLNRLNAIICQDTGNIVQTLQIAHHTVFFLV
jgi:hypothetical protein